LSLPSPVGRAHWWSRGRNATALRSRFLLNKGELLTGDSDATWLIRNGPERARMREMEGRLRPARNRTFAVLAVTLVACVPLVGWLPVLALAVAAALFRWGEVASVNSTRPEYAVFGAWAGSEAIIGGAIWLTGSAVQSLALLAIPIVTLAARFSTRGIVFGVGIALVVMVGVGLGADARSVVEEPVVLVVPAVVVVGVGMLSTALMQSDRFHRDRARVDALTGLLNRAALLERVLELRQQSEIRQDSIGLVLLDLDGFKQLNDIRGHAAGDDELRRVAQVIADCLRAYDHAYRFGGDEVLVLIPGANYGQAMTVAEALRGAVASSGRRDGLGVTASCGVAVSPADEHFDFDRTFEGADRALLEAKQQGGDRVEAADSLSPSAAVP